MFTYLSYVIRCIYMFDRPMEMEHFESEMASSDEIFTTHPIQIMTLTGQCRHCKYPFEGI